MRLGFTPRENDPALPEVHAGDEICALTEARLPLVYKDAGAFDRREFLARQEIHVLATLRASMLLEKDRCVAVEACNFGSQGCTEDCATAGSNVSRVAGDRRYFAGDVAGRPKFCRASRIGRIFKRQGCFHVLVVAGLHVGALAFIFILGGAKN